MSCREAWLEFRNELGMTSADERAHIDIQTALKGKCSPPAQIGGAEEEIPKLSLMFKRTHQESLLNERIERTRLEIRSVEEDVQEIKNSLPQRVRIACKPYLDQSSSTIRRHDLQLRALNEAAASADARYVLKQQASVTEQDLRRELLCCQARCTDLESRLLTLGERFDKLEENFNSPARPAAAPRPQEDILPTPPGSPTPCTDREDSMSLSVAPFDKSLRYYLDELAHVGLLKTNNAARKRKVTRIFDAWRQQKENHCHIRTTTKNGRKCYALTEVGIGLFARAMGV